jgi:protein-S-isoprenylcysteine O-methyltransferase Ste14
MRPGLAYPRSVNVFDRWAAWIHRIATGSGKRRWLFTPIVGSAFALYLGLLVGAALLTDRGLDLPRLMFLPWTRIAGWLLLAAGLGLYAWTLRDFFKRKGTPVPVNPPVTLITNGPYAYCRNPMITGLYLCFFGFGMLIGSLALVVIYTPLSVLIMHVYLTRVEEKELELKFGRAYLDYKNRVPRYLPFPKRERSPV